LIENLTSEQITGILETLPVDITFADDKGRVLFWNRHDTRIFPRPASAQGGDVIKCHSEKSAAKVAQLLKDFAAGKKDCLEYQIDFNGRTIKVINTAVRDPVGKYLGVMEIEQDITDIKKIEGEKRLLS
jgi:PAS domain S-box-containing protein